MQADLSLPFLAAMPPYGWWSLERTDLRADLLTAYEGIGGILRSTA